MIFIITLLALLTLGSITWTFIQIIKPELFFKAEQNANLNRVRPKWYLYAGILGIVILVVLWVISFQYGKTSIWILTGFFTLGSLKPLGMVFFYEKFSEKVSNLVGKMQYSKKANMSIIVSRAVLSMILLFATLYFLEVFGNIA